MSVWSNDEFRDMPDEVDGQEAQGAPPFEPPEVLARQRALSAARQKPRPVPVVEEDLEIDQVLEDFSSDEDEEAEMTTALQDARLRLEMGRLYEMVMMSNLFDNLDADQQAIKNVQRQLKKFAKEQMEVMLGMRTPKAEAQLVSPFNEIEIDVLKALAYKATKGASAASEAPRAMTTKVQPVSQPVPPPKKTTITPISQATAVPAKPVTKLAPKKAPIERAAKPKAPVVQESEEDPLEKPIHEMTEDELAERNVRAAARQANRKAALPPDRQPMPSIDQQNAFHAAAAMAPGRNAPAITAIVNKIVSQN